MKIKQGHCIQVDQAPPQTIQDLAGQYFIVLGVYCGAVHISETKGNRSYGRLIDFENVKRVSLIKCKK